MLKLAHAMWTANHSKTTTKEGHTRVNKKAHVLGKYFWEYMYFSFRSY